MSLKIMKFWFPVTLYSGIIFYVSSWPNLQTPLSEIWLDKVLHVFEYGPFGFFMAMALTHTKKELKGKELWIVVTFISFLYGVTDEIHQLYVIGRTAGLDDVIADAIGGLIGSWIYIKFCNKGSYYGTN